MFAKPQPHIPVFDQLQLGIETTRLDQARLAREHRGHRNKIVFEQLPKDVALWALDRVELAGWKLAARVADESLTVTEGNVFIGGDGVQLFID